MKSRTYLVAGALLFLLTAGIYTIRKPGSQSPSLTDHSKSKKLAPSFTTADKSDTIHSAIDSKSNGRKRPEVKYPELVATYGESRVNLSRHITANMLELTTDFIEMGGVEGIGKLGPGDDDAQADLEVTKKLGAVSERLNLTADQIPKVATLLAEASQRKIAAAKEALKKSSKDPTGMMTQLLIRDAAARGEIDEPEFTRLISTTTSTISNLGKSFDFLGRDGETPMGDEDFVKSLKFLLDSEQQTVIEDELKIQVAATAQKKQEADESKFKNHKSLEEMDTAISALKMSLGGLKIVGQGLKTFEKSNFTPSAGKP